MTFGKNEYWTYRKFHHRNDKKQQEIYYEKYKEEIDTYSKSEEYENICMRAAERSEREKNEPTKYQGKWTNWNGGRHRKIEGGKVECVCGSIVKTYYTHLQTKKHKKYLESLNN